MWRGPVAYTKVRGMTQETDTTHFGFRTVKAAEKASLVRGVFDSVAPRYDLMNDLMSGGIHRVWKDAFVDWLDPRPGRAYLDLAGGTGDIAFRILERSRRKVAEGVAPAHVTVCDINKEMLSVGRDRAIDRGIVSGLSWTCGDAEAVPLPDRSVDAYTIAFGLRNVTHIDAALAEARRVLKPGGRFLCLEFSKVVVPVLDQLYDLYSFKMLPIMGRYVARDEEAYRYLAESIRKFPPQEELLARMEAAGLGQVRYRNLSGGIAAMHSGRRL
ncbi:2-octaprenyl-6-methoxy-1,4-benzoquinone methylase / demethylmenaquinone methyltransferase [Rhodospirillum rubrum ATCC 11170]|uniref:Ubiquinone/menaquinone biosynthesis C-methyltransferase UbiE n=2 Tax=Rhodospirillum rubrum TaxID=1085 RepID=Q2RMQ3_RHORT|nr:2-octaprenyl-6-methoxy-1,4-benzoquinone methylase / demethylmenaquinone methyltransferase [Rhodospirillum rubrum ATCC 11170]MBK5956324.1 bifunctional demethylmenaquinone methyltransferase/2-methoxy-6-polyprenyl-1,4-benzoquinol methylase [Rhodospirillum rubrum]HAQ01365.1 bifunctional demethylmenaquinone methyltransferase/2-methoxy-6-polyprenyl-1,4-benzoquinol methylase UbiE [Rhodospirillum rubrum]HCF17742.1 bifunctional demethylmenaquinone methyltransferase/2-methoxy-6-polyprenyl-1,4-benzoquin